MRNEADQCAVTVLDAPWLPVSYLSRFQRVLQEQAGSLLVDTSSSQPWITAETAEALAAADVATIDAPVSGARWGAQACRARSSGSSSTPPSTPSATPAR